MYFNFKKKKKKNYIYILGCGAFNGNIELKALIQVIAVSATEKSIYYCPFENIKFAEQFGTVLKKLKTHHITSGNYNIIL